VFRVFVLAAALSACAPIHRVARPRERTPMAVMLADAGLICVAGSVSVATYNAGNPPLFLGAFAAYLGLIALDTWAVK
jgi:hypothetical protein